MANKCELICYVPSALSDVDILFDNAEVITSIAQFDYAVTAKDSNGNYVNEGYLEGSLAVFGAAIAVSTTSNNHTYLGADVSSAKWVPNKSVKASQRITNFWYVFSNITYKIGDEVARGYDQASQKYLMFKSKVNGNVGNEPSGLIGVDTSYWEYVGLRPYTFYTRRDLENSWTIGEDYFDVAQNFGFTAIVDIPASPNNAVPVKTASGFTTLEASWKIVDVLNPLRIFEPTLTQRTTRELNYTIEFKLNRWVKHMGFFGLLGDFLKITMWDADEVQVYQEEFELDEDVIDWEEYFFSDIQQKSTVFIEDIPWDYETRVRVEITGAGTCGASLIYPCNGLSFGTMDYDPVISVINPTQEEPSDYDQRIGVIKEHSPETLASFISFSSKEEHDIIYDNIKTAIAVASATKMPLVFKGTEEYSAYSYVIGRVPKITQTLSEKGTTIKIHIEGFI